MMSFQEILNNPIVNRIGFALMHSVWQCTVVAVLFAVVMVALRKRRSQTRYNFAFGVLLLMVVLPALTLFIVRVEIDKPVAHTKANEVLPQVYDNSVESTSMHNEVSSAETDTVPSSDETVKTAENSEVAIAANENPKDTDPYLYFSGVLEKIETVVPHFAIAWIVGVFVLSIWHLGGWAQLRRLRRTMVKPVEDHVVDKMQRIAGSMGVDRAFEIVESALVTVPTVIGAMKPVMLLPASVLTGLSADQLEMILAHELAHIRRNDYLFNLIQTAIDILLFYHPAVWYVSRVIRTERENCCDDIAVKVTGDNIKYARALATLEEIKTENRRLAVAATGGNMFDRVARLVGKEESRKSKPAWQTVIITMLVVGAVVVPFCLAMSGDKEESDINQAVEENKNEDELSEFKAELPDGVELTLIGICKNTLADEQWWRPDGTVLETGPYDRSPTSYNRGRNTLDYVCRLSGVDDLQLKSTGFAGSGPESLANKGQEIHLADPEELYYGVMANDERAKQRDITLLVGRESGWETVKKMDSPSEVGMHTSGDVIMMPPIEKNGVTHIDVIALEVDSQFRVIAIDQNGKQHIGRGMHGVGKRDWGKVASIRAQFSLPIVNIKSIEYQTQRFVPVTFKNVSLEPGFNTEVETISSLDRGKSSGRKPGSSDSEALKKINPNGDKTDAEVEGVVDEMLYQKQDSIKNALKFIGTPEELMQHTTFVRKRGQLANPRQLEFANKLFGVRKSEDVDMFISLLSDSTKKHLNDGKNKRMLHHLIKEIKEGTFLRGQYDFKFFATFREFTDEDWNRLKKHVSFAEPPTHAIVYYHFSKNMLQGSTFYLIEDNGSYKLVPETLLSGSIPVKKEQPTGPKEYGIVSFKQNDDAYTQRNTWKYEWNIEVDPNVTENNTFQLLKTTKVVSGQADLHPEIAVHKIIDDSVIEKYKYESLKFRFYIGDAEPSYTYRKYGQKLSGWLGGFSIAHTSKSESMLFPGEDVTNVKPNKQGNFVGSDLELVSFETSEENIKYEHKFILRKDDSPEAKSSALLKLEQMTQRLISKQKLNYLNKILAMYADDHNAAYPDRLEQVKPYDIDEWFDWLLENVEYVGKGKTSTEKSDTILSYDVLAYDKTLLGKTGGTNVLFNNKYAPLQYRKPDQLKKLGITGKQETAVQVE